jgi:hypothetical protein
MTDPFTGGIEDAVADILAEERLKLQDQFHVERTGNGILAVGSDFSEAEPAVHRHRVFHHWLDGVESHALVADLAGLGNDAVCNRAPLVLPRNCGRR